MTETTMVMTPTTRALVAGFAIIAAAPAEIKNALFLFELNRKNENIN
jgi:hypothetical protein